MANSHSSRDPSKIADPGFREAATRTFRLLWGLLVIGLQLGAFSSGEGLQEPTERRTEDRDARFGSVTEAVIVDLVVRDRSGRPVLDLKPEEVQILENGVAQEILSFQRIEKGRVVVRTDPSRSEEILEDDAEVHLPPQLVSLVFERLGTEGRLLARQAALEFLENEVSPDTLVAVFAIEHRLALLQPFTREVEALQGAVDRVTSGAYAQFVSESDLLRSELETAGLAREAAEAQAGALGPGSSPPAGMGGGFAEARLAEMQAGMLRASETYQRRQQGQSSLYSLLALVREKQQWAGRKTLIYFTEGLQVPPSLLEVFRTTVSEANRSNVSVYAVDARGLTTDRQGEAGRNLLEQAAGAGRTRMLAGDGRAVTREDVMVGEAAEAAIRMNVQENLGNLSQSTGGFLIANTNDLRPGVRRLGEDLVSYYEVSYVPGSLSYDGQFREIEVIVSRPNLHVQSRSGYFAMPPVDGPPVLPYEIPLLAALNSSPPPQEFQYRVRALAFDEGELGRVHVVAMEVPLESFTFQRDARRGVYSTRFSLLVAVRASEGEIIHKFSEDYPLEGPLDRLEALLRGNVVFMRQFELEPGRYTLETVAFDRDSEARSVRRSLIVVPASDDSIRLSSVSLVRRTDPIQEERENGDHPLQFQDLRIVPALEEELSRREISAVPIFFVLYPAEGKAELPRATLELLQDGRLLARAELDLPEPDSEGRIPYMASLPVSELEDGRYELRLQAVQGTEMRQEYVFFVLAP